MRRSRRRWTWSAVALAVLGLSTYGAFRTWADDGVFGANQPFASSARWEVIESPRFRILFPANAHDLAAQALTLAEDAADEIGHRLGIPYRGRTTWLVFPSRASIAESNLPHDELRDGVRAWTPLLQHRDVLVFDGSRADFKRDVRRSVARAIELQELYPSTRAALLGIRPLFHAPDWFVEGIALYFAGPPPRQEEILLRGASLENHLSPLTALADFNDVSDVALAAMEGYSAVAFLAEKYGEETLGAILKGIARHPRNDMDAVLRDLLGIRLKMLNKQWLRQVKKQYWPLIRDKQAPASMARALRPGKPGYYSDPVWSPSGEVIACIAQTFRQDAVWLISARDGTRLRNVTASIQGRFDAIETRGRALAWSPDGDAVLFVTRSGTELHLLRVDVIVGTVTLDVTLPFAAAFSPTFFPDGKRIALAGVRDGQADIYELDLASGDWKPITSDPYFDNDPAISPDGTILLYVSERGGSSRMIRRDLGSGEETILFHGNGGVRAPEWQRDGAGFLFIADWNGTRDIYLSGEDGDIRRLTNLLAGADTVSLSPNGRELAFSAFDQGLESIFVLRMSRAKREPVSLPTEGMWTDETLVMATDTQAKRGVPFRLLLDDLRTRFYTPDDGIPRVRMNALAASWTGDVRFGLDLTATPRATPAVVASAGWIKHRANIALVAGQQTIFRRPLGLPRSVEAVSLESERELSAEARLTFPLNHRDRLEMAVVGFRAPLRYRYLSLSDDAAGVSAKTTLAARFAFVHDTVLETTRYGPIAGTRYRIELERVRGAAGVQATSMSMDARRYYRLGVRAILATRLQLAGSFGRTPERFYLGGHTSLRAFSFEAIQGSRIGFASMELRVPIVDELELAWPARFAFQRIRGVFFMDGGIAWRAGDRPYIARRTKDGWQFDDLIVDFGFGARARLVGLQLRWDIAREYDLVRAKDWRSTFRIDRDF